MEKGSQKRSRERKKRLVIVCALCAIILIVSTYAWFIGMRSVSVSSFDVEIAATDSLLLSLDGAKWSTEVDISKETLEDVSYYGHTNKWPEKGLIPMSSIGQMDNKASRMMMFEKASLTTTAGGYRLMASRVNNYYIGASGSETLYPEQEGYVVFDLFVKNFSGTQYITDLNTLDEEAIYLTTDSSVTVAAGGVSNTGIENSVRVAYAQIGRVAGTTTSADIITGITCTSKNTVTGICRTAQIWEPNDVDHVANAISWYDTSCRERTGLNVTDRSSYNKTCSTVADGTSYPTYAIRKAIASSDNVDIYDGTAYNKYGTDIASTPDTDLPLYPYPYFTDTMKDLTSTTRPTFMTLAPNSITKIRIYIYIEGQDVDNYDFAQIGKRIAVKFGFTKERFTDTDIGYNGPARNVILPDNTLLYQYNAVTRP